MIRISYFIFVKSYWFFGHDKKNYTRDRVKGKQLHEITWWKFDEPAMERIRVPSSLESGSINILLLPSISLTPYSSSCQWIIYYINIKFDESARSLFAD